MSDRKATQELGIDHTHALICLKCNTTCIQYRLAVSITMSGKQDVSGLSLCGYVMERLVTGEEALTTTRCKWVGKY
jgi:hypothetical protein